MGGRERQRRGAPRHGDNLPLLAGAVTFVIGLVNLASAVTPNISWRGELLLQLMPLRAVPLLHTVAVPASVALMTAAVYLRRRRRRALQAAVALLLILGALNLLKGLDFEEAALSLGGAAALWWGRNAFYVMPARELPVKLLALAAALLAPTLAASASLVWAASGRAAEPTDVLRNTVDLLAWMHPSVTFADELSGAPWVVRSVTIALVVIVAYALFRPPRLLRAQGGDQERAAAVALVRSHGSDTLAYFKLRRDARYLFSTDGRALLGYRLEHGVILVAGDPVGPEEALPGLIRRAFALAELHGLRLAVIGASGRSLALWREAGMRSLYIGDEAIVETRRFSLEGRPVRKVRQSVTRLEKAGYSADLVRTVELDAGALAELATVASLWRRGEPERGFSMTMDRVGRDEGCDCVVVRARDAAGHVRGFLQFVPSYGRPAMSLSHMRRDRRTPNGLTEFLVVRAIELLRERGIEELSLNFAAFGRLLGRPNGRLERFLGRLVVVGSRYYQMQSLYRFNAKFSPRWEPRYFLYEGLFGLPRAGVAALLVEGQLPRLRGIGRHRASA